MDIKELESFKLSDAVKFHDKLNPALWDEKANLHPEVEEKLMEIAKDFMAELGLGSLKVSDITLSGSNAAFSYTPHSDLDLHILVDFKKLPDDEVYRELFNAKKTVYNDTHDLKVHGVPVELYVQDTNQPHASLGEYSLLHRKWLKFPIKRRANFDQNATRMKYEKLGELIELALKQQDLDKINKVLDIIKRYRKAGLESAGEFGPENLAFKALRKQGYIQKLIDLKKKLHSKKLSLADAVDEDWHPNDVPPGPETKPTMPQGTVRVDVSDVYDWYKLGQTISNLDRVDKSKFGKGPPSTIMAFGDEDIEHKYIQALKNLGLTTTDIDPVDPHQPKGMPRQKVDPTYNVNENEKNSGYKEIEFVCVNPKFPDATDPVKQKKLYNELKKIEGVIPLLQDWSEYSEGQSSLTAIYKGTEAKKKILELVKKLDVKIDLVQPVSDDYVDRAIRGEHEGQQGVAEAGPFSYGKPPRKDSVADLAAKKRKDQERGQQPIEPKDQQVGVAKVTKGVAEGTNLPQYLYHVTPTKNLKSIAKHGLQPSMGDRSGKISGEQKGIYVFHDRTSAEDAVMNWLGDEFDDEPLTMLKIDASGLEKDITKGADYELIINKTVEPSRIKKVKIDLGESASGYIPSYAEKDDPRFKTALTVDIKPDTMKKNAKAFGFDIARSGRPPELQASGRYKRIRTK